MSIICNAEETRYQSIFLSVDCPWLGRRLNEMKATFALPSRFTFPCYPFINGDNMLSGDNRTQYETNLTWSYIQDLKKKTNMQIWLMGILTAEDAELVINAGADGIVVSNHGDRQLDGAISTLDALPEVAEAVSGIIPVCIDGGIRKGSDIFKALTIGPDYCWVGGISLRGLAYKGEERVSIALPSCYHHSNFHSIKVFLDTPITTV